MTDRRDPAHGGGELLVYTDPGGVARVQVRLQDNSVWLTQAEIADLYDTTVPNVNQHITAIYWDGEQQPEATFKDFLIVRTEGGRQVRRNIKHYNLPLILAVGFRVQSTVGTRFRQWAVRVIGEYAVKGFALDDQRLKSSDDDEYFEELLARIRDIRSSEKKFYRKVLDIYATSIDYDGRSEVSARFFQTVQNKMHWAAHGRTAAEVIKARADADARNMGLTSWLGADIRKRDVEVAKNYLDETEIDTLNRVVEAYLNFAELQARNRRPMTMARWIEKLDDFLRLGEREVLTHSGAVSADEAKAHAHGEFERFKARRAVLPSRVDLDFEAAIKEAKALAAVRAEEPGEE